MLFWMRQRGTTMAGLVGWPSVTLLASLALTQPSHASIFGKDKMDVPQWGVDAAKTHTPSYAKDAPAVILYDEYLETIDAQGHAIEREREVIRILKPQGRSWGACAVSYDVDEKINYFRAWTIAAEIGRAHV